MEGPKTELIASPVRELDSYPSDREEEPDLRERDPKPDAESFPTISSVVRLV